MILGKLLPVSGTSIKTNLMACWELDNLNDSAGNYNLTSGGGIYSVQAYIDYGYIFDSNGYAYNSSFPNLGRYDKQTITAWVYLYSPQTGRDGGFICSKYYLNSSFTNFAGFSLIIGPSTGFQGGLTYYIVSNSGGGGLLNMTTDNFYFSPNTWYHVAVVNDGSSNAANFKLYVNGVSRSFSYSSNNLSADPTNSASFRIANSDNASNESSLWGILDQVAIWNRDLTDQEISYIYNMGYSGLNSNYWS